MRTDRDPITTRDHHRPPSPEAIQSQLLVPFLHDLNNLLGIMLGNAELMMDSRTTDERRVKRAESIHTAAIKVRDLVAKLQAQLP